MAVTLMTTTGTLDDVNAALGIAAGTVPTPPEEPGPTSASVESLPVKDETPAEPAAPVEATPESALPAVADEMVPDSEFDEDGEPTTERAARSSRTKLQTIKKLRIRARDAELRAARAEGELKARTELAPPPVVQAPPADVSQDEPKEADYATYEAFIEARADYRARAAFRDEYAKRQAEEAQRAQQRTQDEQRQRLAERLKAFEAEHPDYQEVVNNPDLILTDAIAYALQTSEDGPAMAYALAKDPARFKAIAAMGPAETMMELGLLRAELRQAKPPKAESVAPKKLPTAPPPPTTVRGGSVAASLSLEEFAKTIQPGDSQTSEWIRRRNEQLKRQGQR